MRRMYLENVKSINAWVGCRHDCVYCRPSFQRQTKRRRKDCLLCYQYTPHLHPERLQRAPPKTPTGTFLFFPSTGDPCFAAPKEWRLLIGYAEKYRDRTLLIQSKDPKCFLDYEFPDNVILGTTIETNRAFFSDTPSTYSSYFEISKAPLPVYRKKAMLEVDHPHKAITAEPILDFDVAVMMDWMREIRPKIIYIGYDNHKCLLPEPGLNKTLLLNDLLVQARFAEVRLKSIRPPWWIKRR